MLFSRKPDQKMTGQIQRALHEVETDLTKKLNIDRIIDIFNNDKPRRVAL